MRRVALTTAVTGMFVLAGVAYLGGCTIFTCAVRGLIGAVAVYLAVRLAGRAAAGIIADAIVKDRMSQENESDGANA